MNLYRAHQKTTILVYASFRAVPVTEVEQIKSGHVAWKYRSLLVSKMPANNAYLIN